MPDPTTPEALEMRQLAADLAFFAGSEQADCGIPIGRRDLMLKAAGAIAAFSQQPSATPDALVTRLESLLRRMRAHHAWRDACDLWDDVDEALAALQATTHEEQAAPRVVESRSTNSPTGSTAATD